MSAVSGPSAYAPFADFGVFVALSLVSLSGLSSDNNPSRRGAGHCRRMWPMLSHDMHLPGFFLIHAVNLSILESISLLLGGPRGATAAAIIGNSRYADDLSSISVLSARRECSSLLISGDDAADFCAAERMGFQAMWDNRRHGQWSTRRRHDSVMKTFGGAMNALVGPLKKAVFEKDAEFSRSCYVHGGKKHRPDMVLDNAMDDNVKFVFDLKNVAPCTRIGSDIVTVADHLRIAEENKRNSPAWKDFVPQDGMACEFVPFAIGWYGEMGREVKSFVRRVADHHIGDAYAKEWRIRRILAQVQVKHLNLIGVYLKTVRGEYERVGAAKKSNRGLPTLELNGWARGIDGDQYSSRVCHEGSRGAVLAISQSDELQILSRSLDSRCDTTSGSGDISLSNKSGDVLSLCVSLVGVAFLDF